MNTYEELESKYFGVLDVVITDKLPPKINGFYSNENECEVVLLSSRLTTCAEKLSVLAEEIGHYETTTGNILDQTSISNQRQELRAHRRAHAILIPLDRLIDCFEIGCRNRYEIADFLVVTEDFLEEAIKNYNEIYGSYKEYGGYILYFNPLGVMKLFD